MQQCVEEDDIFGETTAEDELELQKLMEEEQAKRQQRNKRNRGGCRGRGGHQQQSPPKEASAGEEEELNDQVNSISNTIPLESTTPAPRDPRKKGNIYSSSPMSPWKCKGCGYHLYRLRSCPCPLCTQQINGESTIIPKPPEDLDFAEIAIQSRMKRQAPQPSSSNATTSSTLSVTTVTGDSTTAAERSPTRRSVKVWGVGQSASTLLVPTFVHFHECHQHAHALLTEQTIGKKPEGATRFVCISDTHNRHDHMTIPAGDVLIHCRIT